MKVKAAIDVHVGGRLVIDDLEIGDPGPTHVIVRQFATGVCHSQLHQMHNPALPRPLVLGHEFTGRVYVTIPLRVYVCPVNPRDRRVSYVRRLQARPASD